ncbi:M23 family metallopeptidase [Rubrivirga sp.]|uniref:M23 family metallopeptidase n=1 Tax=Rubrivirga sp. TaxID=1885344 RepID=UPI003B52ECD5
MPHRLLLVVPLLLTAASCDLLGAKDGLVREEGPAVGCDGRTYATGYVLPFPVGAAYRMTLGNCSSTYHGPGEADQYAYDFAMRIGTPITAARAGRVVHVEARGADGGFPNNLVVVDHGDGTFAQYMHLTQNGADVARGDEVRPGDPIGRSGNTGLAGTPHLHFVVTGGGWAYPYDSTPVAFANAEPRASILQPGQVYAARPY